MRAVMRLRGALAVSLCSFGLLSGCATTHLERPDGATASCQIRIGSGLLGLLSAPLVAIDQKYCIKQYEDQGFAVKTTTPY